MTREQHHSSREVEEIGNSKENGKMIVIEDDEELVEIVKSKEKGKMIVIEDDEEVEDFIAVELYEDLRKIENPSTEDALSDDDEDWIKSSGDSPQNPIHVFFDPPTSDVTPKQSRKRKHATHVTTPLPPHDTTLGNSPHSPIGRGTGRGRGRGRGKGRPIDITIMPLTPLLSSQKPLKKIPTTNTTTKQSRKIKHTTPVTTPLQSSEDHVVDPTQIPYSSTSVTETTTDKKKYMRVRDPKVAKKLFPRTTKPIVGNPLFVSCIRSELHEFCIDHVNPLGDENCGFRAYSLCIGRGEEQWSEMRSEPIENVFLHYEFYLKFLGESRPPNMVNILSWNWKTEITPKSHWCQPYPCSSVFADTFDCVLVLLSVENCWTFPPSTKKAHYTNPPVFAIAYVESNHYTKLDLADGCPIPPIHPQYLHHVSAEIQKTWLEILGPRIRAFQKLKVKGLKSDIMCRYDLMVTPVKWSGF